MVYEGDPANMILEGLDERLKEINERVYPEVEDVHVIKYANYARGDDYVDVSTISSTGFMLKKDDIPDGMKVEAGDRIRLHLTQGSLIKGIYIGKRIGEKNPLTGEFGPWTEVYHRTNEDQRQLDREQSIKHQRDRAVEFFNEREKLNADYDALPDVFKKRIDKYRENKPTFRAEYEGYEMFCCTEAVKVADYLRPEFDKIMAADPVEYIIDHEDEFGDNIPKVESSDDPAVPGVVAWLLVHEFDNREYEEQKLVLSSGHSGNTHGMAMRLGRYYLAGMDDHVVGNYGAMSVLVGSDAYGDAPSEAVA